MKILAFVILILESELIENLSGIVSQKKLQIYLCLLDHFKEEELYRNN